MTQAPRRRHATPSEPVTWKRIGVADKQCRLCQRTLVLDQVGHFGTAQGKRFVECKECFDAR